MKLKYEAKTFFCFGIFISSLNIWCTIKITLISTIYKKVPLHLFCLQFIVLDTGGRDFSSFYCAWGRAGYFFGTCSSQWRLAGVGSRFLQLLLKICIALRFFLFFIGAFLRILWGVFSAGRSSGARSLFTF